MNYFKEIYNQLKSLYAKEPTRVISVTASAILFVAAHLGVVVPQVDVLTALAYVLPVLLGGEAIRQRVTPVTKPTPAPPTQV